MRCTHCNHNLPYDAVRCINCGMAVAGTQTPTTDNSPSIMDDVLVGVAVAEVVSAMDTPSSPDPAPSYDPPSTDFGGFGGGDSGGGGASDLF